MMVSTPDFRNPPWVYGPKETMDWIEATYPDKKKKKSKHDQYDDLVKNMQIRLDLNVEHTIVPPSNRLSQIISKILRREMIMEQFDIFLVAEMILRALAKAKFKNTVKIVVDDQILYNHPEKASDLRKTIDLLHDYSISTKTGNTIVIIALLADVEQCTAEVTIKKVHTKKEHSLDIFLRGEIKRVLYHAFLNYLYEKLGLEDSLSKESHD